MTLRRPHDPEHEASFEAFAQDVRAAVPSPPGEETAQRHLAAMRAAAEESARAAAPGAGRRERVGRRRSAGPLRPVLRLGAVTAGALVAFSGASTALAAIGVDLPDPIRAPFDAVGIELPNQPDDDGADTKTPPAGDKRRNPGRSPQHRRDGEHRPSDKGERGRSEQHRRDGEHRPSDEGERGRSEQHRQDGGRRGGAAGDAASPNGNGGNGNGAARGNGNGNAGGSGSSSGNGRGGGSSSSGGKATGGGTRNRPANPAPKESTDRGAGPTRPVKPDPPADRGTPQSPKKTTPSAPPAEEEPAVAPDGTTTTAP